MSKSTRTPEPPDGQGEIVEEQLGAAVLRLERKRLRDANCCR